MTRWALCALALTACGPRVYVSSARYELPQDRGEFASGAVYGTGTPRPTLAPISPEDGAYRELAADVASTDLGCPRDQVIPTHRDVGPSARGQRAYWLRVCGSQRLYRLTPAGWILVGRRPTR
jgi:hypothetical protein